MKDLAESPAWQSAVILAADVRRATGNQRIDTPSRDHSIATATKIAEHIARTVVDRPARRSFADYAMVCLADLRTQFAVYRHAHVVSHDRCDDIEEAASALHAQISRGGAMTRRPPEARVFLDEIVVDSFAGGGGASLGISWALGRSPDIAINHDKEAIALHKANHPETEHFPEDIWTVDPVTACRGRRVGLMWLSPDCKHFSKAKGGKPVEKKIRGLAWTAVRWAKAVRPRVIFLENVEEFQDWGTLYSANHRIKKLRNRPNPSQKGKTFKAFVSRLRQLGYEVEWRQLRGCHYGAPTIRKRLFLIARCDGLSIDWPDASHAYGSVVAPKPAHVAAEVIEWSIPCPSIFTRKKPLAENTMKRIARGIQKFVIDSPRPFIVGLGGRMSQTHERHVGQPFQTICSKADSAIVVPSLQTYYGWQERVNDINEPLRTQGVENRFGLLAPYLIPTAHQGDERAHSVEEPLRTVCGGKRGDHALVTPVILRAAHGERDSTGKKRGQGTHSVDAPLGAVLASGEFGLIAPTLVQRYGERPGQAPRTNSVEQPFNTIVPTGNGADLVATFLAKHNGNNSGHDATGQMLDQPADTLTAKNSKALVTAHIKRDFGQSVGSDVAEPIGTITPGGQGKAALVTSHLSHFHSSNTKGGQGDLFEPMKAVTAQGQHIAEVRAFLVTYYTTGEQRGDLLEPMHTIMSKERFGLVTVDGVDYQIADIGMRMLAPRELYRAQGFPDSYRIEIPFDYVTERKVKGKTVKKITTKTLTKTAQVRMCGNSVNPQVAEALVRANCAWMIAKAAVA